MNAQQRTELPLTVFHVSLMIYPDAAVALVLRGVFILQQKHKPLKSSSATHCASMASKATARTSSSFVPHAHQKASWSLPSYSVIVAPRGGIVSLACFKRECSISASAVEATDMPL